MIANRLHVLISFIASSQLQSRFKRRTIVAAILPFRSAQFNRKHRGPTRFSGLGSACVASEPPRE